MWFIHAPLVIIHAPLVIIHVPLVIMHVATFMLHSCGIHSWHMNESAEMNELWMNEWVIYEWMSYEWHMNEWVINVAHMNHVAHMNEYPPNEWVSPVAHMNEYPHVVHMNETWFIHVPLIIIHVTWTQSMTWLMTHDYWLIQWDDPRPRRANGPWRCPIDVPWHIRVTCLIRMCDIIHSRDITNSHDMDSISDMPQSLYQQMVHDVTQ